MLTTIALIALIAGFIKPILTAIYKAVRVAIVSTKKELAAQLGKVTIEARKTIVEGQEFTKNFEVPDEAFVTLWRRVSVFLHVLLTS